MKNIKLTYMYDGTDFYGFQKQPEKRTIQGEIERVLAFYIKDEINLISSGRTDSGVHASMQVSNFFTNSKMPIEKILYALNKHLPNDIYIKNIEEVPLDFNSRFSTKERVYEYFICFEKNPFKNRFSTFIPEKINLDEFLKILKILEGRHDFKNFKLSDCTSKHQVREIFSITGRIFDNSSLVIQIRGNAFLKSQIRIIIGIGLDIYFQKKSKDYFKRMLNEFDKDFQKTVAPPNGLFLSEIIY